MQAGDKLHFIEPNIRRESGEFPTVEDSEYARALFEHLCVSQFRAHPESFRSSLITSGQTEFYIFQSLLKIEAPRDGSYLKIEITSISPTHTLGDGDMTMGIFEYNSQDEIVQGHAYLMEQDEVKRLDYLDIDPSTEYPDVYEIYEGMYQLAMMEESESIEVRELAESIKESHQKADDAIDLEVEMGLNGLPVSSKEIESLALCLAAAVPYVKAQA